MIIMKFGGTSVGNADRISNTADIIKANIDKKPIVVVSAVSGATNKLIELGNASVEGNGDEILEEIKKNHYEILEKLELDKSLVNKDLENLSAIIDEIKNNKEINNKILDNVQSFGEQMSSKIIAAQLNKIGIKTEAFNAWDLGFLTNEEFGNAEPLEETFNNLNDNIKKLNIVPVITGFIGKTKDGEITTIGRSGSDYTAAIIGSAINADEIQIWTDVNGIMSADPKIVSNTKTLEKVSFAEASELAYFGARVLHPKTILPAVRKNIPVRVLNTFDTKNNGTLILNNSEKSEHVVKAITSKKNIILIHVDSTRMLGAYGFLARLFDIFDKYKKSVDVISTSEVSVSMTINDEENLDRIIKDLEGIANVQISKNKSIICVVGEGMRNTPGVSGRTFSVIGRNKINVEMVSQGASGVNTTFIVDNNNSEQAIKALHEEYFG
jgi:aspartate kinase|tara:strand:- start:522 stop:1841 length:1320 start_codon:yes stop_codon:yes gene_type:complete